MRCPRCGRPLSPQVVPDPQGIQVVNLDCQWGCGTITEAVAGQDPEELALELWRGMRFEEPENEGEL